MKIFVMYNVYYSQNIIRVTKSRIARSKLVKCKNFGKPEGKTHLWNVSVDGRYVDGTQDRVKWCVLSLAVLNLKSCHTTALVSEYVTVWMKSFMDLTLTKRRLQSIW